MDEYQESNQNENRWATLRDGSNRWLVLAAVALFGIAVVAFAYGYHQKSMLNQLTAQSATANATMNQMQGQVNALTAKLNEVTATQNPLPSHAARRCSRLSSDVIPAISRSHCHTRCTSQARSHQASCCQAARPGRRQEVPGTTGSIGRPAETVEGNAG